MIKKLLFVAVTIALLFSSFSCGLAKPGVSGTYICTQASQNFGKDCVLELKKDGTIYWHESGEAGITGGWKVDGDEIIISTEFFGMTWKGEIQGDTIVLMDGSTWVKESEKAAKPTEQETRSPPEVTQQTIRPGMISVGDFSFALTSIEREEQVAHLYFAITKVGDTDTVPPSIEATLTDDHDNKYEGVLNTTPEGSPADFVTLLPVDFTYVASVTITMPKAAPIIRIKLGETEEVAFKEVRLTDSQLKLDFGPLLLEPGVAVPVGKSLMFSAEGIVPDLHTWAVPVTIENKDYNELRGWLQVTVQYTDGTIETTPGTAQTVSIPGLSKETTRFMLSPLLGKGVPDVRMLLMFYRDESSKQEVLRLWPVSNSDFPPRVGQGTGPGEELFVAAYQQSNGQNELGDPLALPRWLAGGDRPKSERDMLVQEFPGVSGAGRSAIIWDEQGNAGKACVIPGVVWEKYLSLGGAGSWLGYPAGRESVSTDGHPIVDFEGGYIGTNDGVEFQAFAYPSGRIAFVGRGAAPTIYVVDIDGIETKNLSEVRAGVRPSLSPDGTKVAYSSWTDSSGIHIVNTDGSGQYEVSGHVPGLSTWNREYGIQRGGWGPATWSPDGTKLAYIEEEVEITRGSWGTPHSESKGWALCVTNLNDGSKKELLFAGQHIWFPSWSPDGSRIAFYKGGAIYSVDAVDGGDEQELVPDDMSTWPLGDGHEYEVFFRDRWVEAARSYSVAASPDGNWLAVTAGRSYGLYICLLGPGNRVIKLEIEETYASDPSWSRIGTTPTTTPAPEATTQAELEVANLNSPELIELRRVVEEVLEQANIIADEDQKSLLNQAEIVLDAIQSDSNLRDLVSEKTEEERLILDFLEGIFAVGAQYFYDIPSLIAGAVAKGAEELGNQIAEWQVLGQLSFARVTQPDNGMMEVVYHKQLGEIWVDFHVYSPAGRVCLYIPVEPALVSSEGGGNILLAEGVRPVIENCRIAYRFDE